MVLRFRGDREGGVYSDERCKDLVIIKEHGLKQANVSCAILYGFAPSLLLLGCTVRNRRIAAVFCVNQIGLGFVVD